MTLISMVLLKFDNFDILLKFSPNLVPESSCSSVLMKTSKMNN